MNFHLSNKPGINTAVMQSTHPQQQRKMTMKKVVSTLMLSTAIVTSSISLPTHAAVIDTVKDKVIAIKKDTGSIKSQTSGIKTRVEEVRSSVNANIAETIDIRSLVEPLDLVHKMKDKFGGGGFDPAELLELIDVDEVKSGINNIKQKREEAKARLNDPDLETFRQDFLGVLAGINTIVNEDGNVEVTPFQTLIEKAPLPIIAVLKASTQKVFPELKTNVISAAMNLQILRQSGVFELDGVFNSVAYKQGNATQKQQFGLLNTSTLPKRFSQQSAMPVSLRSVDRLETACESGAAFATVALSLYVVNFALDRTAAILDLVASEIEDGPTFKVGIHGYAAIDMPKPSSELKSSLERIIKTINIQNMDISAARDLVSFTDQWCGEKFAEEIEQCTKA